MLSSEGVPAGWSTSASQAQIAMAIKACGKHMLQAIMHCHPWAKSQTSLGAATDSPFALVEILTSSVRQVGGMVPRVAGGQPRGLAWQGSRTGSGAAGSGGGHSICWPCTRADASPAEQPCPTARQQGAAVSQKLVIKPERREKRPLAVHWRLASRAFIAMLMVSCMSSMSCMACVC